MDAIEYRLGRAVVVPDRSRMSALPAVFGPASCVRVEARVYAVADTQLAGYTGGYWDFVRLSTAGFYMVPMDRSRWRVQVEGNGYEGTMSRDAAGLVVCMAAYSHMSFETSGKLQQVLADQFHLLRDYAVEHPEASEIFAALD